MSRTPPRPSLRALPSVDRVVRELAEIDLPRPVVLAIVRRELSRRRERQLLELDDGKAITTDGVLPLIRRAIDDLRRTRIQPVINGTGIIIHTNFGRSPLGAAVVASLQGIAANYNNLEFDLATGQRGNRAGYLEHNLALLCGAESATVVNNCAAALVLVLRHFTAKPPRTQVVISRGELIQIGGGFRIPEILEASDAILREVGTTNKTTVDDYRRAVDDRTAMILRVHRSNFYMGGFVESPTTEQLAAVAMESAVPLVEDIGSGATFETESLGGNEREPTPSDVLRRGADLVLFSGDKLLGGPQAGIIAGKASFVAAVKREPFFRALRCDKLILAALQTTVDLLLSGETDELPIRAMMDLSRDQLNDRARRIAEAIFHPLLRVRVGEGDSQVGGGSLPRTTIPSVTVDAQPANGSAVTLADRLRLGVPPIVGYLSSDWLKLDLRTVFPSQDEALIGALLRAAVVDG